MSQKTLDDNNFSNLINRIQSLKTLQAGNTYQIDNDTFFRIHDLPGSEYDISPANTSEMVLIFCPSPSSEKTRYAKKVRDAVSNISKCTTKNHNASRVVFVRMHVNADYNHISATAKAFIDDSKNEVDCIICYQPSYSRDKEDNSLINHCFKIEASPRYALQMAGTDHFRIEPPIGSISLEQSLVIIKDFDNNTDIQISPCDYFFQQGDIYQLAKKDIDGSLFNNDMGSPGIGIRKHGVFLMDGKYMTITPKFSPPSDDLLII